MRISLDAKDSGYCYHAHRYQVYLDGASMNMCITADEEQGYILRCKIDKHGKVMVDTDKKIVLEEELFGKVEIKILGR